MILSSPDPATDPFVADLLLGLQHSSYAVEARLIGEDRLPPLAEDAERLTAWRGRWILAWDGVTLVGAIAWSQHDDHVDLEKVMVSPSAMRRGIGGALVRGMLDASPPTPVVRLDGTGQRPRAVALRQARLRPRGRRARAAGHLGDPPAPHALAHRVEAAEGQDCSMRRAAHASSSRIDSTAYQP